MKPAPRLLLIGASGQLGFELHRALLCLGEVVARDRSQLNLADPAAIRHCIRESAPALLVNAAAFTSVDLAESETEQAVATNATAPRIMAEECARAGAGMVHFSTDYVFDGESERPYLETDRPNPLNVYGASKLEGEQGVAASEAAFVTLRTSWVYGHRGRNFLRTVERLSTENDCMRIVADQFGAPTWARCIADATAQLLTGARGAFATHLGEQRGLYHLSCAGHASWYDFARAIVERLPEPRQRDTVVEAIESTQYPTPARRPRYSVLDNARLRQTFAIALPHWKVALDLALGPPR